MKMEVNDYVKPYGFEDGEHVLVPYMLGDEEKFEDAILHYELELGAWMVIYCDGNGVPKTDLSGVTKTDFISEIGWDSIEKFS